MDSEVVRVLSEFIANNCIASAILDSEPIAAIN
jgi:hypothetical protein